LARSSLDSEDIGYGVLYHYQDPDNYYLFAVGGDGYYTVAVVRDGRRIPIRDWQEWPHVRRGAAANRLRVRCQGATCRFYVNGEFTAEITDRTFLTGDLGLWVETFSDPALVVTFEQVRLWLLTASRIYDWTVPPIQDHLVTRCAVDQWKIPGHGLLNSELADSTIVLNLPVRVHRPHGQSVPTFGQLVKKDAKILDAAVKLPIIGCSVVPRPAVHAKLHSGDRGGLGIDVAISGSGRTVETDRPFALDGFRHRAQNTTERAIHRIIYKSGGDPRG
jgi:hypothetical protein